MRGAAPPLVPLLILLIVALVGGGVLFVSQQQQMRRLQAQLHESQQRVATLDAEHQSLTQELDSLQKERKSLEERVSSLRDQLASASAALEHARLGLEEMKTRADLLTEERASLQVHVASVTGERDDARKRAERLEEANAELERSVVRFRERLNLLDRDYRKVSEELGQLRATPLPGVTVVGDTEPMTMGTRSQGSAALPSPIPQATVELPPIIVRKDQAGMTIPVRGRILEVNEPHNFVVVDKGSMDGVRVGMTFNIIRGAATVGRATVVRVRPQLSACNIVRAQSAGPLQSGDLAVQHGP